MNRFVSITAICLYLSLGSCNSRQGDSSDMISQAKKFMQSVKERNMKGISSLLNSNSLGYNDESFLKMIFSVADKYLDTISDVKKLVYVIKRYNSEYAHHAVVNVILKKNQSRTDYVEIVFFGPKSESPYGIQSFQYRVYPDTDNRINISPIPSLH